LFDQTLQLLSPGQSNSPMYGDFEAQRHWMEVTLHLPANQWYVNSTDNDLLYWGLDYPPLTAYHSYFMGIFSDFLNPAWVALHSSRGIQDKFHKMFMRLTAILPFHFIYVPAMVYFVYYEVKSKELSTVIQLRNVIFRYNSVSLGLFLVSFLFLVNRKFLLGSLSFVLALNYKQMELYHALPIFTFILSRCLKRPVLPHCLRMSTRPFSTLLLTKVATTVVLTFAIIWLPFIYHGSQSVLAVLGRVFPFYLALPSLLVLFLRPTTKNFILSLFITSLAFFLFSFQVHEKSILLAAVRVDTHSASTIPSYISSPERCVQLLSFSSLYDLFLC
ncbi:ALG6, ALG8 glycosyltransferase family protein, partial [Teladorsagia circumcincta]